MLIDGEMLIKYLGLSNKCKKHSYPESIETLYKYEVLDAIESCLITPSEGCIEIERGEGEEKFFCVFKLRGVEYKASLCQYTGGSLCRIMPYGLQDLGTEERPLVAYVDGSDNEEVTEEQLLDYIEKFKLWRLLNS